MVYLPVTLLLFILLFLVFPFIWFAVAVDVVEVAVAKLGFSPDVALGLLVAVLLGSTINLPIYRTESPVETVPDLESLWIRRFLGIPLPKMRRETLIALNVGGGLIPTGLAIYQFWQADPIAIIAVTAIVTAVSYFAAQIVPGIGIQMNPLLAPLMAALCALLIAPEQAPPVAFAGGILGTLIGADVLHLKEIERMSPGILSIGGAGVFDGIALCGLFALLLT